MPRTCIGPFLHPNGHLSTGASGQRLPGQRDAAGKVLHEGASSGIWSAKPDGSDVQWHCPLAGDNPVEMDFTPQGELIGVQNVYISRAGTPSSTGFTAGPAARYDEGS